MSVRAILFDVGDTLLRVGPFEPDLGPAIAAALRLPSEDLVAACSRGHQALVRELIESYRLGLEDERHIGEMLLAHLRAEGIDLPDSASEELGDVFGRADVARLEPREGVVEALREFQAAGYRLAAVSNTTTRPALLTALFEEHGLFPCLEHWVFSVALGVRKPHPLLYEEALRALNVRGEEAVFVGDRVREDVLGPRRAGIAHAVLTHEYRQEDPGEANPCAVITRLEELHDVLPRLD